MSKTQPFAFEYRDEMRFRHSPIEIKESVIPMTHEYHGDRFYIRECYDEYYECILNILDSGRRVVTLTGTPGIGKSMFYYYFFERFRNEFSNMTVVTAAFNVHSMLTKCKVFTKAMLLGKKYESIPDIEGDCIYLYDGPPRSAPSGKRMVCFTSPRLEWLDEMTKVEGKHQCISMKPWSREEMWSAVKELGSQNTITKDILNQRYEIFGGAARQCLLEEKNIDSAIETWLKATRICSENCARRGFLIRIMYSLMNNSKHSH